MKGALAAFLRWIAGFLDKEQTDANAKAAADAQRDRADQEAADADRRVVDVERDAPAGTDRVQHDLDDGHFFD